MKINIEDLLKLIRNHNDWIESSYLADFFNVSSRTIRNYVNKINSDHETPLILSSYKGYKISTFDFIPPEISKVPETYLQREDYIVRKLLNSSIEIDIYTLSDELFISDSTIDNDLKQIKSTLSPFELTIERNRNIVKLIGPEKNKRKLINSLISKENSESLITFSNIDSLTQQFNISSIYKELEVVFNQHNLYVNDYGLNNIILHIVVTIDRICNKQTIEEISEISKVENTKDFEVATHIKFILEKHFDIQISQSELYYLTLIISSNSNTFDYSFIDSKNISTFIDREYIEMTEDIVSGLEKSYSLNSFNDEFLVKFTIHIRNLFQRIKNNSFTKNPLAERIKSTYPLVYDMALYIANSLLQYDKRIINGDEIAFIAFHLGAYFETINSNKDKVSCYFVYADYHNMHLKAIEKITSSLSNDLNIVKIVSIKDIHSITVNADFIIANCDLTTNSNTPVQVLNVFVNDSDITLIRKMVLSIKLEKKKSKMQLTLNKYIGEKLFKKNYYAVSPSQLIQNLVNECTHLNLCEESYFDEVMERENLSPTSFSNGVAIPHSLNNNARKSFLSIVINEKSITWGNNKVNMIVLIGTSSEDRALFKDIFDDLIAILYEPTNIYKLHKCDNYFSFISTISEMIVLNQY